MLKTKEHIVLETVIFYGQDPKNLRSVDQVERRCLYNHPDGKECAFARCVKPEHRSKLVEYTSASKNLRHGGVADLLMPEYNYNGSNCNHAFWNALQKLHDTDYRWDEANKGLTQYGIEYTTGLILEYAQI